MCDVFCHFCWCHKLCAFKGLVCNWTACKIISFYGFFVRQKILYLLFTLIIDASCSLSPPHANPELGLSSKSGVQVCGSCRTSLASGSGKWEGRCCGLLVFIGKVVLSTRGTRGDVLREQVEDV